MKKPTSLREQQLALTRERIITGLAEMIETRHPMDVTMAAVAGSAGVSEPTLYRHFPTKKQLFTALGSELYKKSIGGKPPSSLDELVRFLPELYDFIAENEAVVRWNLAAPKDQAVRPSAEERLPVLRNALSAELADLPQEEAEYLLRAIMLLTSPMGLLYWQDYLGLSVEDSAATAAWLVRQFAKR
jgi:AcrR family transcriptional regulator